MQLSILNHLLNSVDKSDATTAQLVEMTKELMYRMKRLEIQTAVAMSYVPNEKAKEMHSHVYAMTSMIENGQFKAIVEHLKNSKLNKSVIANSTSRDVAALIGMHELTERIEELSGDISLGEIVDRDMLYEAVIIRVQLTQEEKEALNA